LKRYGLGGTVAALAFTALFGAFFLWPLARTMIGAFWIDGQLDLEPFRALFANPGLLWSIIRAAQIALAATILASLFAMPAAFLMARCQFAFRRAYSILLLVPMVLPPFVGAIGLKRLLGRFGSLNLVLMDTFGLDEPPVDWLQGDLIGVVVLHALHLYPILYLIVQASFRRIDPSLEEAGRNLGLAPVAVFYRVALPLVTPAYAAGAIVVFVWAFTDVGTPLLMGVRDVVAVRIFERVTDIGDDPTGHALVVVVVVISILAFLLARALAPRERNTGATKGASRRPERPLGLFHTICAHLFLGGLVTLAVLPHVGVVLLSVAERWFLTPLPTEWSGRAFTLLVDHPLAAHSIRLTLTLAALAMVIDLVLGVAIAFGAARGTMPAARLMDAFAMAPLAVPGIVLAFGLFAAYAGTRFDPITHSPYVLLTASWAVRRLPFAVRSIAAGVSAVPRSLEEASRNLGVGPRKTFLKVTLPFVMPHLIAAALLTFIFAAVEVSDSLILAVRPEHYPMTKAIWELLGRLDDGPMVASAMGVLVMLLLAVGFAAVGALLGRGAGAHLPTPTTRR